MRDRIDRYFHGESGVTYVLRRGDWHKSGTKLKPVKAKRQKRRATQKKRKIILTNLKTSAQRMTDK